MTDTSGAIIPGATVAVKSVATATQFDTVTNESGYFSVPALDPGVYTVTVTLMGFKTAVLNDVRINASTPATVKVALAVGGLEETVVVTGGSEMIQTTSAAVTSTIDTNQILKIPTGSRSALEFVALLPGVSTPGGPGGSRDSTVNGLPQSAINITIDGMSAQDNHLKTGDGFFARVSPRLDAIEEVTVNSAAQDASSTGQGAVQIRFVTRSGSNQFTGSGYYYLQHYNLNANTWFNNRDNAPKADDVLHQPGGRIGGPVMIPGVWNGRNKAFFFFNYEESRSPGANTENRTMLHPRAEQGWFRYTAGGVTREVNVLSLAATNGFVSTIDPTIGRLLGDIRASTAGSTVVDSTDPLHADLHLLVPNRQRHEVPDRAAGLQPHRQAPPVVVDDLHGSGLDAGYHEQPRAQLPRLPEHRQPGLGSLHHPRHAAVDARRATSSTRSPSAARAGRRCSRRRSRRASSAARGRRPGRVPAQHQHCRRHHERGLDRRLLRRARRRRRSSRTRSAG